MKFTITTQVAAPRERVFDCARDMDLHQRSMARYNERAIDGVTSGLISAGEEVTWRARHLGVYWKLTTRIEEFEPPRRFRDVKIRGSFASFEHDHVFEEAPDATVMRDVVRAAAPLGPLGWLAERLVLERTLRRLIQEIADGVRAAAEAPEAK